MPSSRSSISEIHEVPVARNAPVLHGAFPVAVPTQERDNCQFCLGAKGGVLGNENVYNGVVACDFCSVLLSRATEKKEAA